MFLELQQQLPPLLRPLEPWLAGVSIVQGGKLSDCIFCKIVAGEIPSDSVGENDGAIAFRDINPEAAVHILVVPKKTLCRRRRTF